MNPATASRRASLGSALALALLLAPGVRAHEAPGPALDFTPPAPGSYRLERIMRAPDGKVIDMHERRGSLAAYTRGKITLLSLMYTACTDGSGCPLAFHSIALARRDLERDRAARGRVQLVSLSFDPQRDTPQVMRAYAGEQARAGAGVPWHFLTTGSPRELMPLLAGFDQDVSRPRAAQADEELLHVLKLFLIDGQGWVREIYTSSYLSPRVLVNDIRTLLMEGDGGSP